MRVKKFTEFILHEGFKDSSMDSMDLYRSIRSEFIEGVNVDRPYDEFYETIDIRVKDESLLNDVKRFISAKGWYVSKEREGYLEVKPIHSQAIIKDVPSVLYHAAPSEYVNSIMKDGLIAKNMDVRHKYPDRIYVSTYKHSLYPLIKELKRWKNIDEYTIIEIDTNGLKINLYKDLTSIYKGNCYIQGIDKIDPRHLKIIEEKI